MTWKKIHELNYFLINAKNICLKPMISQKWNIWIEKATREKREKRNSGGRKKWKTKNKLQKNLKNASPLDAMFVAKQHYSIRSFFRCALMLFVVFSRVTECNSSLPNELFSFHHHHQCLVGFIGNEFSSSRSLLIMRLN